MSIGEIMNWKLSVLSIALISSGLIADVSVRTTLFVNNEFPLTHDVVVSQEEQTVVQYATRTINFTLLQQDDEGALVQAVVNEGDDIVLDTELSLVWNSRAVAQVEVEKKGGSEALFVKLECEAAAPVVSMVEETMEIAEVTIQAE